MRKAARTCQVLILEALGVTVRASLPRMRTQQGLASDCNLKFRPSAYLHTALALLLTLLSQAGSRSSSWTVNLVRRRPTYRPLPSVSR